jgi:hypothetical protein
MDFELSTGQAALVSRASDVLSVLPSGTSPVQALRVLAAEALLEPLAGDATARLFVCATDAGRDAGRALGLGAHLLAAEALASDAPLRGAFVRAEKIGCIEPGPAPGGGTGGAIAAHARTRRVIGAAHADYILWPASGDDPPTRLVAVPLSNDSIRHASPASALPGSGIATVTLAVDPRAGSLPCPPSPRSLAAGLDLAVAAAGVGLGRRALDLLLAHLRASGARGGPLSPHQGAEFVASDIATELEAAWLSALGAACRRAAALPHATEAASARWLATDAATHAVARTTQVVGDVAGELAQLHLDAQLLGALRGASFEAIDTIASQTLENS